MPLKPPNYKEKVEELGGAEIDPSRYQEELKKLKEPGFADVPRESFMRKMAEDPRAAYEPGKPMPE